MNYMARGGLTVCLDFYLAAAESFPEAVPGLHTNRSEAKAIKSRSRIVAGEPPVAKGRKVVPAVSPAGSCAQSGVRRKNHKGRSLAQPLLSSVSPTRLDDHSPAMALAGSSVASLVQGPSAARAQEETQLGGGVRGPCSLS